MRNVINIHDALRVLYDIRVLVDRDESVAIIFCGWPAVAATHQYASEPKKAAQKSQSSSSFGGTAASATPFLEEKAPEGAAALAIRVLGDAGDCWH